MLILATLAEQLDYYGFLAADQLGLEYSFVRMPIDHEDAVIDRLAGEKSLIRARELFEVGLDGRGRSEWNAAIQSLSAQEIRQAAILAHRWGWHSRAITTAAKSGDMDDLELRYPLPHRKSFELFSSDAKIRESWAYGIARNESLFMRDIRSSAGAVGVMQLLPETGRRAAREISYPYKGRNTLIDPDSNIRLGTFYLGKMYSRFYEHAVPATAAYNAGPLRVEQWLPASGAVDARIWIENIPFNETRKYVRRVLASDTIFRWRLTGETQRISAQLNEISVTSDPAQAAGY
jgi:soluble lytic murein transglycosylase